eukprot:4978366-Alexandrium_andersonii.AAC.1
MTFPSGRAAWLRPETSTVTSVSRGTSATPTLPLLYTVGPLGAGSWLSARTGPRAAACGAGSRPRSIGPSLTKAGPLLAPSTPAGTLSSPTTPAFGCVPRSREAATMPASPTG